MPAESLREELKSLIKVQVSDQTGKRVVGADVELKYKSLRQEKIQKLGLTGDDGMARVKVPTSQHSRIRRGYISSPIVTLQGAELRILKSQRRANRDNLFSISVTVFIEQKEQPKSLIKVQVSDQTGKRVVGADVELKYKDLRQEKIQKIGLTGDDGMARVKVPASQHSRIRQGYISPPIVTLQGAKLKILKSQRRTNRDNLFSISVTVFIEQKKQSKSVIKAQVNDQNNNRIEHAIVELGYNYDGGLQHRSMVATGSNGISELRLPESEHIIIQRNYVGPPTIWIDNHEFEVIKSSRPVNDVKHLTIIIQILIPAKEESKSLIKAQVTDQNNNRIEHAIVELGYNYDGGLQHRSMVATGSDGISALRLPESEHIIIQRNYVDPPTIWIDNREFEVIKSSRPVNDAKRITIIVQILIPADQAAEVDIDEEIPDVVLPEIEKPDEDVTEDDIKDSELSESEPSEETPPYDSLPDEPLVEETSSLPEQEKIMTSKHGKRLFRFNAVRPVKTQVDTKSVLEYDLDPSQFMRGLMSVDDAEAAIQKAENFSSEVVFFELDSPEMSDFGPMMQVMRALYSLDRNAPLDAQIQGLLTQLHDKFGDDIMRPLIERDHEVWDLYLASHLLNKVSKKTRASITDCLRAGLIIPNLADINKWEELDYYLLLIPILPKWFIRLFTGSFRTDFSYIAGISDLLVVKEELLHYERGEIAKIVNVMATEDRMHSLRQVDTTSYSSTYESETTKENSKTTSTSTHESLAIEIENKLSTEAVISTGITASASYGPSVKVDTNASFDFTTASENSRSSAEKYAQDVVETSVQKVSTRIRTETVSVVTTETEENQIQKFINTAPDAEHVIGVYRHLDQIWRAQVYNYGRRLMLDLVVPEPAIHWQTSQTQAMDVLDPTKNPGDFSVVASELGLHNYSMYAIAFGANNVPPPPDKTFFVSQTLAIEAPNRGGSDANSTSQATGEISLPQGYFGKRARVNFYATKWRENNDTKNSAFILINGTQDSIEGLERGDSQIFVLNSAVNSVNFGVYCDNMQGGVVSVRIECECSPERWAGWQDEMYQALKAASDQQWDVYNATIRSKKSTKSLEQKQMHPIAKRTIERQELKRAAISLIAEDTFLENGSVSPPHTGSGLDFLYNVIDFDKARTDGSYARFFEEAFEWDQMTYLYYPYFWARSERWNILLNEADPDVLFENFLRSGSARVNLSVRPGFEGAVMWFMATGEIWLGGPVPGIGDPLYIALIDEIKESKGLSLENPIPVGKSWTYSMPTSHIILDPDDRIIPPPKEPDTE